MGKNVALALATLLLAGRLQADCLRSAPMNLPEYLVGVKRIVRATAIDGGHFLVLKVYRGGDVAGRAIEVKLNPDLCTQSVPKSGRDYLVMQFPRSEFVIARTVESASDVVAFLEKNEPPLTRAEMIDTIELWQNGALTDAEMRKWMKTAWTRDVDDWRVLPQYYNGVLPASFTREVIAGIFNGATPRKDPQCAWRLTLGPRIPGIVALLRLDADEYESATEAFTKLLDDVRADDRAIGCGVE